MTCAELVKLAKEYDTKALFAAGIHYVSYSAGYGGSAHIQFRSPPEDWEFQEKTAFSSDGKICEHLEIEHITLCYVTGRPWPADEPALVAGGEAAESAAETQKGVQNDNAAEEAAETARRG